jgi:hypothetical protein
MSIKTDAIVVKDETVAKRNTAFRVGSILLAIADDLLAKQIEIDANEAAAAAAAAAAALKAPINNPTFTGTVSGVTKAMVGLPNAENTSDLNKPLSNAEIAALALKANSASPTFTGTVSGVTKAMVGLPNAENTSDAAKPISTAAAAALALKADLVAGLVPQNQLPSYVDDILEFANLAAFPTTGEIGKIYIAISPSSIQYRWTGSAYAAITNGFIASTNDVAEGSNNLYFTGARVLATLLTGLSFVSSALISATDSVLVALGKLQAQISLKANLASPTFTGTVLGITKAMVGLPNVPDTDFTAAVNLNTANTSRVSVNTAAASITNVRSLRYREETYSTNFEIVMETSVGVYAWVNIKTNVFNVVDSLVTRFKNRVATDGGTFQNQTQLETFLGTITSTLSTVLAAVTPSALKAGKLYAVIGNTSATDMTVVRNTPASTINSAGLLVFVAANIPRFRHLTIGGDALIQDEPQATNLILQSNDFTNALWSKNDTVILSTNNISPDGTLNATRLGFSAQANATLQQTITTTSGQPFSTSFWVRRVSGSANVFLRAGQNLNTFITISSTWQRFTVSSTSDSTIGRCAIGLINPIVGTDVIEIYYSQLENTPFATSTITATTTAAVTRNADVITMTPPTGTVKITTTFSDNSTQVLTTIPATFTLPEGLTKNVIFSNTL